MIINLRQSLRWFYEGRACDTPDYLNPKRNTEKANELGTYSGKIEFVSQSLTKHLPDDKERPPMPRYIPSWEGPEFTAGQEISTSTNVTTSQIFLPYPL